MKIAVPMTPVIDSLPTSSAMVRASPDRRFQVLKGGHISHQDSDPVSILKFFERNWVLTTITCRSRHNVPNPITIVDNPYVPVNSQQLVI